MDRFGSMVKQRLFGWIQTARHLKQEEGSQIMVRDYVNHKRDPDVAEWQLQLAT